MDVISFINQQMTALGINYHFLEYKPSGNPSYPYFVGELTEEPILTEDGQEGFDLTLTGFHRGESIAALEADKQKIKNHFDPIYGYRAETEKGAIVIWYESAFYIPSGEASLKKIQINLTIKSWKGD